jgi:MFS family permease
MQVTMVVAGFCFAVGAALQAGAQNMAMLVIGRCILGLGVGIGTMVGPVYLAEIAPPKLRGTLNVIFQLLITIGILAAGVKLVVIICFALLSCSLSSAYVLDDAVQSSLSLCLLCRSH